MKKGNLYLIPNNLGENSSKVGYQINLPILESINYLIVENGKAARKFLKSLNLQKALSEFEYLELNKHTTPETYQSYLNEALKGENIGVISDAGCPGVADPGAEIVRLAHNLRIRVIPLVGPSSILLALMASGFNGQQFLFHGYLPKERRDRISKIKLMESESEKHNQTQIFIETPFRNQHIIEDVIGTCKDNTLFCTAANLTLDDEKIVSDTIGNWKKLNLNFQKKPAVFLIHSSKKSK